MQVTGKNTSLDSLDFQLITKINVNQNLQVKGNRTLLTPKVKYYQKRTGGALEI